MRQKVISSVCKYKKWKNWQFVTVNIHEASMIYDIYLYTAVFVWYETHLMKCIHDNTWFLLQHIKHALFQSFLDITYMYAYFKINKISFVQRFQTQQWNSYTK